MNAATCSAMAQEAIVRLWTCSGLINLAALERLEPVCRHARSDVFCRLRTSATRPEIAEIRFRRMARCQARDIETSGS